MDMICSKPQTVAGRTIRNDGDCCNPVFTVYEGRPLCRYHYLRRKASEDCPICLNPMLEGGRRVMLNCNHFFHIDCLGKCKEPLCPLCRKQMTGKEAAKIFTPTKFTPIIEEIYTLPVETIDNVVDSMTTVVSIAKKSDWHANHVAEILSYLQRTCALAENISRRETSTEEPLNDENDRYFALDNIISEMINMMHDMITSDMNLFREDIV